MKKFCIIFIFSHCSCSIDLWQSKKSSPTGNWTPVSRVTGGDTYHYTIEDCHDFFWKKIYVSHFCVSSLVMYFLYSLCIVWGTSMMMEQDLFALPKTQMSVDWKYTLLSNLQDIDNLLKKCSFKHNILLLLEDSWPFMNQWHSTLWCQMLRRQNYPWPVGGSNPWPSRY